MIRLVAWTIEVMFPAAAGLPGAVDTDVVAFVRQLKSESSTVYWTGNVLGAMVFMVTPILTVYWPVPAILLPAGVLDRHANRVADHPLYLVRQAMLLVKVTGAMCWASHPSLREKWALPPYGPDVGTFRPSSTATP